MPMVFFLGGGEHGGSQKASMTSSVRVSVGVDTLEHEHPMSVPQAKVFLPGDNLAALLSSPSSRQIFPNKVI